MKIKPLYLLNVILAIVLVTSLLANASIDKSGTAATREYDPFKDLNNDGIIDLLDLVILANYFETSGTPINTTALLLELQSKVEPSKITTIHLIASRNVLAKFIYVRFNGLSISEVLNYTLSSNPVAYEPIYQNMLCPLMQETHYWLKVFISSKIIRLDILLDVGFGSGWGNVTILKENGAIIGEFYHYQPPNDMGIFFINASDFF